MLVNSLPDRIAVKIDVGDCWEWRGAGDSGGYGQTWWEGRVTQAHRAVWEALVGPIPEGLEFDHLCRNRICVNPDHLELVTHSQNVRRGARTVYRSRAEVLLAREPLKSNGGGWQRSRSHCGYGHPYDQVNTRWESAGHRGCRVCDRARRARYYERNRERINARRREAWARRKETTE